MFRVNSSEPVFISSPARGNEPHLQLYVVSTGTAETRAALRKASELARGLNARLVLLHAQIVPYPVPLDAPPVPADFTAGILAQLAAEQESEVTVRVFLCRDRDETIRRELAAGSLVVIGPRKWWRGTPVLVRLLQRDGHHVISK